MAVFLRRRLQNLRRRCGWGTLRKKLFRVGAPCLYHLIGRVRKLTLVPALSKPGHPQRIHITSCRAGDAALLLVITIFLMIGERPAIDQVIFVGGE